MAATAILHNGKAVLHYRRQPVLHREAKPNLILDLSIVTCNSSIHLVWYVEIDGVGFAGADGAGDGGAAPEGGLY